MEVKLDEENGLTGTFLAELSVSSGQATAAAVMHRPYGGHE